ncbi:PP2C family protein-serine/threonine phosphatase [Streptomyces sp. BI20]|uniref:PP2C family protein-serine/threonine phosphatase n=1 Tax=Streptomyces sp. BI20 TaxID=3403460 RepID=UPI003C774898
MDGDLGGGGGPRSLARLWGILNWDRCLREVARIASEGRGVGGATIVARGVGPDWQFVRAEYGRIVSEGVLRGAEAVPGGPLAEALATAPVGRCGPRPWPADLPVPGRPDPDREGEGRSRWVVSLTGRGPHAAALVLCGPRLPVEPLRVRPRAWAPLVAAAGAALSAACLHTRKARLAETLQEALRPPRELVLGGLDLACGHRPAAGVEVGGVGDGLGGDFYDVYRARGPERPGGHLVFGDVCGSGARAAVIAGLIRSTCAALLRYDPRPDRLLQALNERLLEAEDSRFATLVLAAFHPGAPGGGGGLTLDLTSAGHPPPLILRRDGGVERAATSGTLVGVLPVVEADTWRTRLEPGETCLFYTDGVTEARGRVGREEFGEERLAEVLAGCRGLPVEAVVTRVESVVAAWHAGRGHDDLTVLALAPRAGRDAGPAQAGVLSGPVRGARGAAVRTAGR